MHVAAGDNLSEDVQKTADNREGKDCAVRLLLCATLHTQFANLFGEGCMEVDKPPDAPHTSRYTQAKDELRHAFISAGHKPYQLMRQEPGKECVLVNVC